MRTAIVQQVARVSIPDTGQPALQITTDLEDRANSAFYVRPDVQPPLVGATVRWGDRHAIIDGQVVRKLGYSFDPNTSLR